MSCVLQAKDYTKTPAYPAREYGNLLQRIHRVQADGPFVLAHWWDALDMESESMPVEARVGFLSQLAGDVTLPNDMVGDRNHYKSCSQPTCCTSPGSTCQMYFISARLP